MSPLARADTRPKISAPPQPQQTVAAKGSAILPVRLSPCCPGQRPRPGSQDSTIRAATLPTGCAMRLKSATSPPEPYSTPGRR